MSTFKVIAPEDQTVTPFKVYKSWEYSGTSATRFSELTNQGITLLTAIKPNYNNFSAKKIPLDFNEECFLDYGSSILNLDVKNVPTGIEWYSLNHRYFNLYETVPAAHGASPITNVSQFNSWQGTSFQSITASYLKTYDSVINEINPSGSVELTSLASVISIPQNKFGEEIKPGSLSLIMSSSIGGTSLNYILQDDGKGNLIDTSISSSVKLHNRIFYLGFNQDEYESNLLNNTDNSRYPTELKFYNVGTATSFINTQVGTYYSSPGTSANLNLYHGLAGTFSSSYVRIDSFPSYFNPKVDDDYAVSLWFYLDTLTPGHGQNSHIITKRGLGKNVFKLRRDLNLEEGGYWNLNSTVFPYEISVTPAGTLLARAGDGTKVVTLNTSVSATTPYHCVFQKSGSAFELWLNGTRVDSELNVNLVNITNTSDIFIGSFATRKKLKNQPYAAMEGKIDEVQIFNTHLTSNEIKVLSHKSTLNTNLYNRHGIGKVFYKEGLIVISSINPKYGAKYSSRSNTYDSYFPETMFASTLYNNGNSFNIDADNSSYISSLANDNLNTSGSIVKMTVQWNSTQTLYENEILCRMKADEFNFTMNHSIFKESENSQLPKDFIYNDEFGPYITTIGLYNENAELLAIGKLANPIKKRSNVDLNIIVRFDQ